MEETSISSKNSSAAPRFSRLAGTVLVRLMACVFTGALCACTIETGPPPSAVVPPHLLQARSLGMAPDFSLLAADGSTVSLAKLRGEVVVINFWAPWCALCVHELPSFQNLATMMRSDDLKVITVAVDSTPESAREIFETNKLTLPLLFDTSGDVQRHYGAFSIPETVAIDRNGRMLEFPDPGSFEAVTSVEGGRRWDSTAAVQIMRYLTRLR